MIDLILNEPDTSVTIEGSVFDTDGLYFLILTSTKLSTDTDGLSLGSGALSGVGTAFVFWVD